MTFYQSWNFGKRVHKRLASQVKKFFIVFTNMAKLSWTFFIKLQLRFLKDLPLESWHAEENIVTIIDQVIALREY